MDIIVLVFVGVMCMYLGAREYNSPDQSKIFVRYPVPVKSVEKYNHFCGELIIGFGIVAEFTLLLSYLFTGIISFLLTLLLIVEAIGIVVIYRKNEPKFRKTDDINEDGSRPNISDPRPQNNKRSKRRR